MCDLRCLNTGKKKIKDCRSCWATDMTALCVSSKLRETPFIFCQVTQCSPHCGGFLQQKSLNYEPLCAFSIKFPNVAETARPPWQREAPLWAPATSVFAYSHNACWCKTKRWGLLNYGTAASFCVSHLRSWKRAGSSRGKEHPAVFYQFSQ